MPDERAAPFSWVDDVEKQMRRELLGAGSEELHTADSPKPLPFREWWLDVAANDADMVWSKARDYGNLEIMGRAFGSVEDVLAFYALGKLQRILNQLDRGAVADQDSWRDLVCYAMIARRVSETGAWPA